MGEGGRKGFGVLKGERAPLKAGFVGVTGRSDAVILVVRWREENVDLCNVEFGSPRGPETDRFFDSLRSLRSFVGRTKAAEAVREEARGVTGESMLGRGLGPSPRLPLCFLDGVFSVRFDGVFSVRLDGIFSARAEGVFSARLLIEGVLMDRAEELLSTERLLVRPEPSRPLAVLGLDLFASLSAHISCSSNQVCSKRSRSVIALVSGDMDSLRLSRSLSRPSVNVTLAESCSSGGRDRSDTCGDCKSVVGAKGYPSTCSSRSLNAASQPEILLETHANSWHLSSKSLVASISSLRL